MQVNKIIFVKFFLISFIVSLPLISCGILNDSSNELSASPSPSFYAAGLISDWNKKNPKSVGEIAIFNIGKRNDVFDDIIKAIPKTNPVYHAETKHCDKFGNRATAFIIITSDVLDDVSKLETRRLVKNLYNYCTSFISNINVLRHIYLNSKN